jgi:hypothetical protein
MKKIATTGHSSAKQAQRSAPAGKIYHETAIFYLLPS